MSDTVYELEATFYFAFLDVLENGV